MRFTLSIETKRLIRKRIERGDYQTVDQVVQAALGSLEQAEKFGDFEPGELDRLIAEGEVTSGEDIDGESVFQEIRQLREQFRRRPRDV